MLINKEDIRNFSPSNLKPIQAERYIPGETAEETRAVMMRPVLAVRRPALADTNQNRNYTAPPKNSLPNKESLSFRP